MHCYDNLCNSISSDSITNILIAILNIINETENFKHEYIRPSMITLEEKLFIRTLNLSEKSEEDSNYNFESNTYFYKNIRFIYIPDGIIRDKDNNPGKPIRHFIFDKQGIDSVDKFCTIVFDKRCKEQKVNFKLCKYILDLLLFINHNYDYSYKFDTFYTDDIVIGSIVQFEYNNAIFKALDKALNLKFADFSTYISDDWYNYKIDGMEMTKELINEIYNWSITLNHQTDESRTELIMKIFDYNLKENFYE